MNGLILKDMYIMKGSIMFMVLLTVVFAVVFSWNSLTSIVLVSSVMMTSVINGSYSTDHTYGWDAHAVSIGIPRRDIVRSRFEFGLVFIAIGLLIGIVLGFVIQTIIGYEITVEELTSAILMSLGISLISASVVSMVNYYAGPSKAQILSILCTSISVAGSVIIGNILSEMTYAIPNSASLVMVAIGVVLFAGMYLQSQKKYAHTDL